MNETDVAIRKLLASRWCQNPTLKSKCWSFQGILGRPRSSNVGRCRLRSSRVVQVRPKSSYFVPGRPRVAGPQIISGWRSFSVCHCQSSVPKVVPGRPRSSRKCPGRPSWLQVVPGHPSWHSGKSYTFRDYSGVPLPSHLRLSSILQVKTPSR